MSFDPARYDVRLEQRPLAWREKIERAYLKRPEVTHQRLVYDGYWDIAAQLKIDFLIGRLSPPVASLEGT